MKHAQQEAPKEDVPRPPHQLFASHAHSRQMRTTWRAWSQYTQHIFNSFQVGTSDSLVIRWLLIYLINKLLFILSFYIVWMWQASLDLCLIFGSVFAFSKCTPFTPNININSHNVACNKLSLMHMQMHCLICIFFETKLQLYYYISVCLRKTLKNVLQFLWMEIKQRL